jgi:hypothetical protein
LRTALPGVRLSDDHDYGLSRPSLAIAGEQTMTHLLRPLASARAEAASAGVLAASNEWCFQ